MYMVFEDRLVVSEVNQQYVGVSYLISEAYARSEVRVIFTGSNVGMKTKLKELSCCLEEGELVLAFIDLVADNQNTWGVYSRLVDIANRTSFQIKDKSFYNSFMGRTGEPKDLMQKEWAVVQMLPIFFTGDGKIAIRERQVSFIGMMDKMYEEFEKQINHYNAIGFNVGNSSGIAKKYKLHREYLLKRLSS